MEMTLPDQTLLRRNIVEKRTGLARSTIYSMMQEGNFPRPLRVGKRAVRWLETDIAEFVAAPHAWGINHATKGDRFSAPKAEGR